jgi:Ca-activated chloride channel family protein
VYGQFDEKLMNEMASITGGRYFKTADAEGLKKVLGEIDKLEKTTVESPRFVDYSEYGPKIAVIAIFALILGFIAENIFFIKTP